MTVYEIGEDGEKWFVAGCTNVERARVAVVGQLREQLMGPHVWDEVAFSYAVCAVLDAAVHRYSFVVVDRERDERLYSDVPPWINPYSTHEHGVDWIGCGIALGFTMPTWASRGVRAE